ncbi:putative disease resistance RPP13-like protein 1 [Pistacia vera]|uniref:putative disease resistance RPP13-like protein 1 n=1 Tax=Pistacia vera TaxID=55513 RepID=UPI001262FBCD|nr:putative disease resistance RPP13-like protein 1 [Pistacia vera]XP_031277381.1 putative disease resistance RPP13-like protein 1 [Pistacia vera]
MPVGEVFLSAALQVLFDRLVRGGLRFALQEGVRSKIGKWEQKLKMIGAVLSDAEEKQLTEKAVKMWLEDLQDLAYDVEDILDEFATEAFRCRLIADRLPCSVPTCFTSLSPTAIKFKVSMRSKIKDIDIRLEELSKTKDQLGLIKANCAGLSTAAVSRPTDTTSLTKSSFFGRDDDKAKILEMLLRDKPIDDKCHVIAIVGMGGIGKTTLAQEVYNHEAVEDFNLKAWIYVSDDFDVLRISKAIFESITRSSCNLTNLDTIQAELRELVRDRKFLLVLDDVWSAGYDKWESLKSPFIAGAQKGRIIVTARDLKVASRIPGSTKIHELALLADRDCWSVFIEHAFKHIITDADSNLMSVREKVIAKCGGLPLAAKTLGGLLSRQRENEWEEILNKEIWNESYENDEILPVLRLSYYHLPWHLKRCFAYCAIFPKNFDFVEKQLVSLWMTEGLIQATENNKQLEEIGGEYFRDLLSISLFQKSSRDNTKFAMHDLVHDLTQWVSKRTYLELKDELGSQEQYIRTARHSSYISGNYDGKKKFEVFRKVKRLRTFLPMRLYEDGTRYITSLFLYDLMPKLKKLRVLSLATYYITELPDSFGGLIHLRYLNLSQTKIRYLPESTSSLYNLQILLLADCCYLLKLPSMMKNLINLRHLDISGANLISEMPLGMKDLTCLQRLSNFIVGKDIGSDLEDLKCLKDLREKLCISKLENSQHPTTFILRDMRHLKVLVLEWSPQLDHPRDIAEEERVLDWLQPHENLEELTIKCYGGTEFPPWAGNPSLHSKPMVLRVLRLENCKNCTSLPSLGLFTSLEELIIKNMTAIKRIGSEIYGEGCFQSLVNLCFEGMEEWEHWDPIGEYEPVERFPCLRKLSIKNCPKLCGAPFNHLQSLEKLVVYKCGQLVVSFSSFPRLCELEIDGCKKMACSSLTDSGSLKSMTLSDFSGYGNWLRQEPSILTSLQELYIRNCEALTSLPEGLEKFSHLECLEIKDCDFLTSIVRDQFPSSLRRFSVLDCENLQSLFDGREGSPSSASNESKLEHLSISNCPALEWVSLGEQSFSALKFLEIWNCPKLTSISPRGELPAVVKHLQIRKCSELTTLVRDKLPETLEYLQIDRCQKLESIAGRFHNNLSLRFIRISNCKKLQSLPDGLHNLSGLHGIDINDCLSLVGLPQGGLPTSISSVSICKCAKLEALHSSMNKLNSIQELTIQECPSIPSCPAEGFPINLTSLSIEDQNIRESSLLGWRLPRLRCLKNLSILGCSDAVSFPPENMLLPASLTMLKIQKFQKLKHLSSQGFQSLTALEHLLIGECPNLTSLPEEGLPPSLLRLRIFGCYKLEKQCKRGKGKEWSKIAHIPCVEIDHKFIYEE